MASKQRKGWQPRTAVSRVRAVPNINRFEMAWMKVVGRWGFFPAPNLTRKTGSVQFDYAKGTRSVLHSHPFIPLQVIGFPSMQDLYEMLKSARKNPTIRFDHVGIMGPKRQVSGVFSFQILPRLRQLDSKKLKPFLEELKKVSKRELLLDENAHRILVRNCILRLIRRGFVRFRKTPLPGFRFNARTFSFEPVPKQ